MELYADGNEHFSAVVTVVSAAVIVVFALSDRSWPLVALGLLSFFIETIAVMHTVLDDTISRLVAVMFGLVVVSYVAVRAQRMGGSDRRPART